ncbi:MAG: glucose-6-phosphate isomerase, partial [Gammaproteobacteria bacterium]|nr:glucose-6-phosphate isomerase [Gammaproteobacteria bacterium]
MEDFDITQAGQWPRLNSLAAGIADTNFRELLGPERAARYRLEAAGLYLDYSRNLVTDEVMGLLAELAESSPLAAHREAMFSGEAINASEERPVLHTALRAAPGDLQADGLGELAGKIEAQKNRIREVSERIRAGEWLGHTGKPVCDIVNLGIGGSDLGPKLACEALKEFAHERLRCHFVSNVDGEAIRSTLRGLDPETTLVIVS